VDLQIPIELTVFGECLQTTTVLVSRHGAMVRYSTTLPVGTRLEIRNLVSGAKATFRVVWAWPDGELEGQVKLGLEMVESAASFWGAAYERLDAPIEAG